MMFPDTPFYHTLRGNTKCFIRVFQTQGISSRRLMPHWKGAAGKRSKMTNFYPGHRYSDYLFHHRAERSFICTSSWMATLILDSETCSLEPQNMHIYLRGHKTESWGSDNQLMSTDFASKRQKQHILWRTNEDTFNRIETFCFYRLSGEFRLPLGCQDGILS